MKCEEKKCSCGGSILPAPIQFCIYIEDKDGNQLVTGVCNKCNKISNLIVIKDK